MALVEEIGAVQVGESSPNMLRSANTDYWLLAARQLKSEEPKLAEALDGITKAATVDGGDVVDNAIAATNRNRERLVERQWQIHFRSRTVKVRDHFDKILTILKAVKDVGSAAAGLDPVHAGLPWAGICLLMQLALSDSEQYTATVSNAEEVSSIISRYRQAEIMYLQDEDAAFSQEFEPHLIDLYATILKFEVVAACYFRRNTMTRFLRSIPKLDDVSAIMIDIRKRDSTCKDLGQLLALTDARKHQKQIMDIFKTHDSLLEKMIKELREQDTSSARILRWISDLQYDTQHRFLKTKLGDEYQESGRWLLERDPNFQMWRHNTKAPALFWLHGRVGTGKSSLAYLTIESLCRHKLADERVAYYYCVRSQGNRTKPDEILGSILRQVSWSPIAVSVSRSVKTLYETALEQNPDSKHSILSLSEKVELLMDAVSSSTLVKIVIDALDECADHRLLLKSLKRLWEKFPGKVKVFVTGRENIDVQHFVSESSGYDIDSRGNAADVELFIKKEIEKRAMYLLNGTSKSLEKRLRTILVDRAHGMFRWVELQLAVFLDSESGLIDEEDVIAKLDELEKSTNLPDLNVVYDEIYDRNTKGRHSRSVANRVFKWMMALADNIENLSNFNVRALVLAVSIEGDGAPNAVIDLEYVLRVCSNLVVVDSSANRLVFAHPSVLEYLAQRKTEGDLTTDFDKETISSQVAESCLLYLNRIDLSNFAKYRDHHRRVIFTWDSRPGDYFALFAFHFWPLYSSMAGSKRLEGSLQQAFTRFLLKEKVSSPKFESWLEGLHRTLSDHSPLTSYNTLSLLDRSCCSTKSPLFLACAFDFPEVVDDLQPWKREDLNALNYDEETGLKVAIMSGHPEMIRCLIRHGVDLGVTSKHRDTRRSALVDASEIGNTEVVRILLANGVETNEETSYLYMPKTALHTAVRNGHGDIVKLLLDAKADCNAVCSLYLRGNIENKGRKNEEDMTPLEHALHYLGKAAEGQSLSHDELFHRAAIVHELLKYKGVFTWDEDDFVFGSQWAPIHFAIYLEHIDIAEMLIDYGANVNARAGYGLTALHMAVDMESLALVQNLLAHGADINARWRSKGTPLMIAALTAHESMVRLILSRKARDSCWAFDLGEAIASTVFGKVEPDGEQSRDAGDEDDRPFAARRESVIRLLRAEGADLEAPALSTLMRRATSIFDRDQLTCYEIFGPESSKGKIQIPGMRPLYIAAVLGESAMAQVLLDLGADVNAKDSDTHMPAIYEAVMEVHEDMVRLLLAAGAQTDVKVRGYDYASLVEVAEQCDLEVIAKLLREHMPATREKLELIAE